MSLARLISEAITFLPRHAGENASARRRYFDWLFRRVLKKRFEADSYLVGGVAEVLRKSLFNAQEAITQSDPTPEGMKVLQDFYADLPAPVQEELRRDPVFMASLGLRPLTTAAVDDMHFDRDTFLRAASEAINGREATIVPVNMAVEVLFRPIGDPSAGEAFCFDHPVTGNGKVVRAGVLGLLRESPMEREATLRQNRQWLDCPSALFEQEVAEIVALEDPTYRIERMEVWLHSSAEAY